MKQKYRLTFSCSDHGSFKIITQDEQKAMDDNYIAPCPQCKAKKKKVHRRVVLGDGPVSESDINGNPNPPPIQKAPSIGGSNIGKAVDATARMVMEDYGMTDLRDNVRQGEAMAPKLAPRLQEQADSFFSPKKNKALPSSAAGQIARAALSGKFSPVRTNSPDPMGMIKTGVKANIVAE